MLEVFQFIFSSLWVFIGALMLLAIVVHGIVAVTIGVAAVIRGHNVRIE